MGRFGSGEIAKKKQKQRISFLGWGHGKPIDQINKDLGCGNTI
jgi:hypothetical protein